jgi:hypothetical protein
MAPNGEARLEDQGFFNAKALKPKIPPKVHLS